VRSLIAVSLLLVMIVLAPTLTHDIFAKSKDSKAKDAIIKALGKSVEGKYSKISEMGYQLFGDNSTVVFWNKTTGPVIPPKPPTCLPTEHLENGKCVPNVTPSPTNTTKVVIVGDVSGTAVRDGIAKQNPELVIALGDLGYKSTLSWFKTEYVNKFPNLRCVVGNHEAASEDGSSSLEKEAKALCKDSWKVKVGNSVLFYGFNTNGNLDTQLGEAQDVLMDSTYMNGITSVHFVSHKPICSTPPNSHHPLELSKTFCNNLIQYTPNGVKVYFDNGHNHVLAQTKDGLTTTSGAGGKSHYDCGTNAVWIFCNNKSNGYLLYTINTINGDTTSKFYDASGKVIN